MLDSIEAHSPPVAGRAGPTSAQPCWSGSYCGGSHLPYPSWNSSIRPTCHGRGRCIRFLAYRTSWAN